MSFLLGRLLEACLNTYSHLAASASCAGQKSTVTTASRRKTCQEAARVRIAAQVRHIFEIAGIDTQA